jgi:hypothetical protein
MMIGIFAVLAQITASLNAMGQTAPTPTIPIEIAPSTQGVAFSNMTFYLLGHFLFIRKNLSLRKITSEGEWCHCHSCVPLT